MNCRGVSRRLSAFIDDVLSPGIKESLEDHLKGCLKCQRKLAEIKAIIEAAHNLPSLKVSEEFTERVLAVASKQNNPEVVSLNRYRVSFAGLAFVATAVAVFFIMGPIGQERSDTRSQNTVTAQFESAGQPELTDYSEDPSVIVYSVPVPEEVRIRDMMFDDSLQLADSSLKLDQFILPEVEQARENVNIKF